MWIKFPNQINNLLRLRSALQVASALSSDDLRDDECYGYGLLSGGVIASRSTEAELRLLPHSRQGPRTAARALRELFVLLDLMEPVEGGFALTDRGRTIAAATGATLSDPERHEWTTALVAMRFPHPAFPDLSPGVTSARPAIITLKMVAGGPLPAQGLAFAFAAGDESDASITRARELARTWGTESIESLASAIGTTVAELRNNSKVLPGMLAQLGLIEREAGEARITEEGRARLKADGDAESETVPSAAAPMPIRKVTIGTIVERRKRLEGSEPAEEPSLTAAEREALRQQRLEQRVINHQRLLLGFEKYLSARGFDVRCTSLYDALALNGTLGIEVEAKTVEADEASQIRAAVGQLLYYSYFERPLLRTAWPEWDPEDILSVVVLDRSPSAEHVAFLEGLGFGVAWAVDADEWSISAVLRARLSPG